VAWACRRVQAGGGAGLKGCGSYRSILNHVAAGVSPARGNGPELTAGGTPAAALKSGAKPKWN
jgi:hypothetical protein